jgi:O-methyltransferase
MGQGTWNPSVLAPSRPKSLVRKYLPASVRRSLRGSIGVVQAERKLGRQFRELDSTLRKVKPLTMVPEHALVGLARQVGAVLDDQIPGAFVECGVWRGGTSLFMADLLRQTGSHDRAVWLIDTVQGLPPPSAADGPLATSYAENSENPAHYDNCTASLEEVQASANQLNLASYCRMVKGWFDLTLALSRESIGPIALLRIDADWHDSVYCCLENLYDQVSPGGFVVIDDYYTWDGCAVAVHEFLGSRHLPHRLYTDAVAFFRKQ